MIATLPRPERIAYYVTLLRIAAEQECYDPVAYANHVYFISAQKPHHWKVKSHD